MTLQECYAAIGGDYEEVMGRLPSERMVQKFVLKFLADGSYALLLSSVEAGDWQEAFRASHTIKGVCQNLGFTQLYKSSSELSEAMRDGKPLQDPALLERVTADYQSTASAIRALQETLGV